MAYKIKDWFKFVTFLALVISLILSITFLVLAGDSKMVEKKVSCYDEHDNEMNDLTCTDEEKVFENEKYREYLNISYPVSLAFAMLWIFSFIDNTTDPIGGKRE